MEVGACHNGFCDSLATDITRARRGMSDYGLAQKVSTLFGTADDLHFICILHIIHTEDCPVTWRAILYRIRPGSQAYNSFLGKLPTGYGDTFDDEHRFSSPDRRSI